MTPPSFNEAQRVDLRRLELDAGSIARLERILPLVGSLLAPRPTASDVRDELRIVAGALSKAVKVMEGDRAAKAEAAVRLQEAALNAYPDEAPDVLETLRQLYGISQAAVRDFRAEQRHSHAAHPLPVRVIDEALQYKVPVSREGPFAEIMEICYAASGRTGESVERAIRAYLELPSRPQQTRPKSYTGANPGHWNFSPTASGWYADYVANLLLPR